MNQFDSVIAYDRQNYLEQDAPDSDERSSFHERKCLEGFREGAEKRKVGVSIGILIFDFRGIRAINVTKSYRQ